MKEKLLSVETNQNKVARPSKRHSVKELQIDDLEPLTIFVDDFAETKSIKSCCRVIDVLYKYATNLDSEYPSNIQTECYEFCLEYLEKLKILPKHGEKEKAYNYLALYVEGALRFINADLVGAVKVYEECSAFSDFNNIEQEWPDDRVAVKIAIHSNLYFIYDFLDLDFGKSVQKSIVDEALAPDIEWCKKKEQELRTKIRNNPACANSPFDPSKQPLLGSQPTNQDMLDFYVRKISEQENWTEYPKFRYMNVGFNDWGSFTSCNLAEAVFDNKWGSISLSSADEECELKVEDNSIVVHENCTFTKEVVTNFSEIKKGLATKIRLLYV